MEIKGEGPASNMKYGTTSLDEIAVTKAYYLATSGSEYQAQLGTKLDPNIINTHPARDFFRKRLAPRQKENMQIAAVYTTLDNMNFVSGTDSSFAQGATPPAVQYSASQHSKPKAHYGVSGGLTYAAIAAMNNPANAQGIDGTVMDAQEREMYALDIAFRNSEDWMMINGNTNVNPLNFNGLTQEVTAGNGALVLNLAGQAFAKSDINTMIATQSLIGIYVTAILANPMTIKAIKEAFYNTGYQMVPQQDPYAFETVPTPAGQVALIGDPHIPVTVVSGGNCQSDIYLLVEEHDGQDILYMDYLIPETMLPAWAFTDGLHATSIGMGMYSVGAIVNRAPIAQARITNAGFTIDSGVTTQVVSYSSLVV